MKRLFPPAASTGTIAAAVLALMVSPALAGASVALSLEMGPRDEVHSVRYSCADGSELTVQYINSADNALAILQLAGEKLIFVNVVAGSGARYGNGAREWWTKGSEGTLRNQMTEAGPVSCTDTSAAQN